ncbi:MAG: hypothetical protein HYX52_08675 [Chloroflexi bacterium]|nr:hypothetical protein [Chloroflexota bacterium]
MATITTTAAGTQEVTLPEGVTLEQEGKGTVADLKPGLSVGVTGKPDGTAISIRIFQASTTVRPGQLPMAGAQAGNTMTNAVIQSFDGDTLTVQLGEQRVPLKLPAGTEVLKPVSAALSDLSAGKRVNVTAVPTGPNGALIATSVYVPGAPPPIAR